MVAVNPVHVLHVCAACRLQHFLIQRQEAQPQREGNCRAQEQAIHRCLGPSANLRQHIAWRKMGAKADWHWKVYAAACMI